jgi:glutamate-ammonia-ligase adenylyltransferase
MAEKILKDAAGATPDPERAFKNLSSFLAENPSGTDELQANIGNISMLFSFSQFLANYCIANPHILFETLRTIDSPQDREALSGNLFSVLREEDEIRSRAYPLQRCMALVRGVKMRETLRITLRDILEKIDLTDVMLELSVLADVVLEHSLSVVRAAVSETYGSPADDGFAVVSLGKLGGEELNFSSDVDLVFVYGTEAGETSGVTTAQGINVNRISNHEYYCKIGEALTRFLSLNTEDGFAYRVDLRLRPEGQRGAIALSLRGYEMYYESWGRAWERAMLLRARPVAGEPELGRGFMEMIRPFVYRKYLDYSAIDEIRSLKTRIDSTFKKGDIKRGYGGIREIEFFAQALQLIYGGREPLLRERSTMKVLHRLFQKALVGQEDYLLLSENYRYLRTLEHRLQQVNNLQTHTLPSSGAELESLAAKMGCGDAATFTSDLEARRKRVRGIYDSLFMGRKEEPALGGTFFDEETSDAELRDHLSERGLKDVERALRSIKAIKNSTFTFQTLRGRRLLGEILPQFVESALSTSSPDTALNHLQSFAELLGANESYLEIFRKDKDLVGMLTYVFSHSEYLSRMLLGRPRYLEMIGWGERRWKSVPLLKAEIESMIAGGRTVNDAIRLVRQAEEIRLGLFFLRKRIGAAEVTRGLSKTAEAILSFSLGHLGEPAEGLSVMGFGKLGGREITFGSDLDVIFVSSREPELAVTKAAEKFLRMLVSYTKEGVAYRVDTRLRPEGGKGPLVSSLESFRKYYEKAAAFWEFQALLKARPVAGSVKAGLAFVTMAKETLTSRGKEVSAADITQMRERILKELAREQHGWDIKLGPGGIEEIEFTVQYLQLTHCGSHGTLLVQGTVDAVGRLYRAGVVGKGEAKLMKDAFLFYRGIESFLRLRGENILMRDEEKVRGAAEFMGFGDAASFIDALEKKRKAVREFSEKYLTGR